MARSISVREIQRDDELGLIRKEINFPGQPSFETPTVSLRQMKDSEVPDLKVNEITRRIDSEVISSLEEYGTQRFVKNIRSQFAKDKTNLTIFDLRYDSIPDASSLQTLSHTLHSSSETAIFLPTVGKRFLQDIFVENINGKSKERRVINQEKIKEYIAMMNTIIDEINIRNNKPFIGTIPLLPPKHSRPIVQFYLSKGINSFAIDANTADLILNDGDLRVILSEIHKKVELNDSFIYACNLGIPQFEQEESRADDMLSLFTYIDVLGGNFKQKAIPQQFGVRQLPRAKVFSRDHYAYKITTYSAVNNILGFKTPDALKKYNKQEQLHEANKVRNRVGDGKIKTYLQTKSAVDSHSIRRLETVAERIRSGYDLSRFFTNE